MLAKETKTVIGTKNVSREDAEINATYNQIVKSMNSAKTTFVSRCPVEMILIVTVIVNVMMTGVTSKFVTETQTVQEDTGALMEDANLFVKPQEIAKKIKFVKMANVSTKQSVSGTQTAQEIKSVLQDNVQAFVKPQVVLLVLQDIAYLVLIVSSSLIAQDYTFVIMKITVDFVYQEDHAQAKEIVQEVLFVMLDVVALKIDATNITIVNMVQDVNKGDVLDLLIVLMIWIATPMNIVTMEFAGGDLVVMILIVNQTKNVLMANVKSKIVNL